MEQTSEALLALKPVTCRYKKEIDPAGISQFGLVAEGRGKSESRSGGTRQRRKNPTSVRYDQVERDVCSTNFLKAKSKLKHSLQDYKKWSAQLEAKRRPYRKR